MSADDRTETQWGIRYPDGKVDIVYSVNGPRLKAELSAANEQLANAHSAERAVIVTRTRTITYTEWKPVDE